jgi:hypothetical protein
MPNNLNAGHDGNQMGDKKLTVQQIKQFLNDPSMEVTKEELNEILEAELQKPEDKIDLQLVDDILAVLNPREVSEEEISASWDRFNEKLRKNEEEQNPTETAVESRSNAIAPKNTGKGIVVFLRRAGLIAAAIVLLFFVSLGSAKAMKWTFLLKLLNPIAQTFGISLDVQDIDIPSTEKYSSVLDDQEMRQFTTEDEIPVKYDGYRIKLNSIPERYSYIGGTFYPSQATNTFNFMYQSGDEWISYNVNIFKTDNVGIEYQFETTMEVQEVRQIGMIELTFYHNGKDKTQYVSWVDRNAHYSLYGCISIDELTDIINGFQ